MEHNSIRNTTALSESWKAFLVLCRLRSFSQAADVLGVTQSALSKNIRRLESEIGITLFDRSRRPVSLTPEAQVLRDEAETVLLTFEKTLMHLKAENFVKPVLRFGCVESLCRWIAPAVAKAFCDRTSRFMQFQGSSETLIEKLLRFETDVVLISDAFEEVPGLARTLVFEEPSVLVLPAGMDPDIGKTWNSLRHCGLPMISSTGNSGAGRINDRFLSSMRMSFPTKYEAESDAVMIEIIRSGAAWALTRPTTVLSAGGSTEGITVAPMPEPEFARKLYIVTRGGEFEAESADIHAVCKRTLSEAVLPKLAQIAPWTTPKAY